MSGMWGLGRQIALGKMMECQETGSTQGLGRWITCRETDGAQGDGWHMGSGRQRAQGETDSVAMTQTTSQLVAGV